MPNRMRKLKTPPGEFQNKAVEMLESEPIPNAMESMTDYEAETYEKILSEIMNLEKNRGAKSRIPVPVNFARLQAIVDTYKEEGYPKAARILDKFTENLRENQVSEDGERIKEVVRALSESIRQDRNLTDKLSAPPE